ncbi:hypothetical protein Q0601_20010 [Paracoccus onubensis]|uniref:hypothetical protein n=1 Tax=Paracoccus onubensis TaxID=1675788 RepID=UPI00272EF181|nr:hypothetical protein [Paracoccus onubensis]MDP0929476.1 hypothetical protein [Paracoccus onubensis]
MTDELKKSLRFHWESGFLRKLRYGVYDEGMAEDFLRIIQGVPSLSESRFDKELTYIIWHIPLYLEWQSQRLSEKNVCFDRRVFEEIREIILRKFDSPHNGEGYETVDNGSG